MSTVKVPGVSVMESARINRPIRLFNRVFTSTIPGLIGKEGESTRRATSKLDFTSSLRKTAK